MNILLYKGIFDLLLLQHLFAVLVSEVVVAEKYVFIFGRGSADVGEQVPAILCIIILTQTEVTSRQEQSFFVFVVLVLDPWNLIKFIFAVHQALLANDFFLAEVEGIPTRLTVAQDTLESGLADSRRILIGHAGRGVTVEGPLAVVQGAVEAI